MVLNINLCEVREMSIPNIPVLPANFNPNGLEVIYSDRGEEKSGHWPFYFDSMSWKWVQDNICDIDIIRHGDRFSDLPADIDYTIIDLTHFMFIQIPFKGK
jgi:hypothetical protein